VNGSLPQLTWHAQCGIIIETLVMNEAAVLADSTAEGVIEVRVIMIEG
jgi:hypothetical protein